MRLGDAQLPVFFKRFGVDVAFGGATAKGIVDEPSILAMLGERMAGTEAVQRVLLLPFNAFAPMPAPKQPITIDGANYTVLERHALDDGRLVQYGLKQA